MSGAEHWPGAVAIRSDARVVACLVCEDRLLPIVAGPQLVNSGSVSCYARDPSRLRGIVEGAQWVITHTPGRVMVADTRSTNGSVHLPRTQRDLARHHLLELFGLTDVQTMGWDGQVIHEEAVQLCDGDVLVNIYRVFLYVERQPLP